VRFLTSYRRRRRLAWAACTLLVVVGLVVAALTLPRSNGRRYLEPTGTQAPQTVAGPGTQVPLTKAARREIGATLAAFVRTGVTRSDPTAAWDLVTPAMREGISRRDWNAGELPVVPLDARPVTGWTVLSSSPGNVTVDLLVHPRRRTKEGAIAYAVDLKLARDGRWLVDSMVPEHVFAAEPARRKPLKPLPPGFKPSQPQGALRPIWFLVPATLLGLAILVPLAFGVRTWLRQRRIEKRYRAGRL